MSDAPKETAGKLQWDLFPFDVIEDVVQIYEFGTQKYYKNSWRKGFAYSKIFSAALRHLFSFFYGMEDIDPESGKLHIDHAIWNLITLSYMIKNEKGTDDRMTEE